MKGTPEMPQCGFSRASVQILGLQGVDPTKFAAVNVLESDDVRQGLSFFLHLSIYSLTLSNGDRCGGANVNHQYQ
jgi:monothiol glutaredoxin